jgi:hypothetical protein
MDVGEPPASVRAVRGTMNRRFEAVVSYGMPPVIAGVSGYVATLLYPDASSWALATQVELFIAVAVPVGVVVFFFERWYARWLTEHLQYHPRRVAILGAKLRIELPDGRTFDHSLKSIGVSDKPLAEDWYAIAIQGGRIAVTFYAPALVANAIRTAKLTAS